MSFSFKDRLFIETPHVNLTLCFLLLIVSLNFGLMAFYSDTLTIVSNLNKFIIKNVLEN